MKLRRWLELHEMTMADFGGRVGAHHSAVVRWCNGERTPGRHIVRIMEVTKGEVGPADFDFERAFKTRRAMPPRGRTRASR